MDNDMIRGLICIIRRNNFNFSPIVQESSYLFLPLGPYEGVYSTQQNVSSSSRCAEQKFIRSTHDGDIAQRPRGPEVANDNQETTQKVNFEQKTSVKYGPASQCVQRLFCFS